MIRNLKDAPANVLALSLSGTVIESDLVNAVNNWANVNAPEGPAAIVLQMEEDFDGYDAEIVNALASGDLDCRIGRVAVLAGDSFSPLTEAELADVTPGGIKVFGRDAAAQAYAWLAAA